MRKPMGYIHSKLTQAADFTDTFYALSWLKLAAMQ
jgi:hypothetical protein